MNKALTAIILAILLVSCGSNGTADDSSLRPVRVGEVFRSADEQIDVLSGVVVSGVEASPSFAISGMLKKIYVKEGSQVSQGQLLAEIDAANYTAAYKAAKSKFEQVSAEVARVEELYRRSSVNKNDYEKAIDGRQTVSSLYETAKSQLESTKLYAPISGIVQRIDAELYKTTMPGIGVMTIVNTQTLNVETSLSSTLFVQKIDFQKFVGYSEFSDEPIPLKLLYIAPKANNNQLYKMALAIDSKKSFNLAPGMAIKIELVHKPSKKQELSVLLQSIFKENGDNFVWIVGDDLVVNRRKVEVGKINQEGRATILSGLDGTERLVTAGVSKLQEGQKIKILE